MQHRGGGVTLCRLRVYGAHPVIYKPVSLLHIYVDTLFFLLLWTPSYVTFTVCSKGALLRRASCLNI